MQPPQVSGGAEATESAFGHRVKWEAWVSLEVPIRRVPSLMWWKFAEAISGDFKISGLSREVNEFGWLLR